MKINLFALINGAAFGFAVGSLISCKLLCRRKHTGGSFAELYEDNKGGDLNA